MAIYRLFAEPLFPDPEHADPDGLLAVGGDLTPERLISAYSTGVFPWYAENSPILWWSTNPRLVLFPDQLHVSRSLRRVLNRECYSVTYDTAFDDVIRQCAATPRPDQDGTWLVPEMVEAYTEMHRLGLCHSVEAWRDGELAGGLYGISLGRAFFGESMFFSEPDASKVAFVHLVRTLAAWDFQFIDCQQTTSHLKRFGASEISRRRFLDLLGQALHFPTLRGNWKATT
ncbi:MAG: leucyl/phenylalanyl-tRNA--protein transferase [Proteobacteria bacterium]|nr:leucyl/phenylalanyl-tRNA--protein transferase [Pseudomonadota bacterium]